TAGYLRDGFGARHHFLPRRSIDFGDATCGGSISFRYPTRCGPVCFGGLVGCGTIEFGCATTDLPCLLAGGANTTCGVVGDVASQFAPGLGCEQQGQCRYNAPANQ